MTCELEFESPDTAPEQKAAEKESTDPQTNDDQAAEQENQE
jgi:hypothetical protein